MAYWAGSDRLWQSLTPTQKAAAMALLEADNRGGSPDMESATNVLGAIVNRATKEGADLGEHVSGKIYQPTIEAAQQARLPKIVESPAFQQLTTLAESRLKGETPDWVQGATHFLAPEKTMLALEEREPSKYRNWGPRGANWTGYDPETGSYRGVVLRDRSHAFLIPGSQQSQDAVGEARGLAPLQTAASPAPAVTPAKSDEGSDMNLGSLFGGMNMGAFGGSSVVPSMASGTDPDALNNLFGSLASFGGGSKGGGDSSDSNLASSAMTAAGAGGEEAMPKMAARPFDMQKLASMLKNSGYLGTSLPRRPA